MRPNGVESIKAVQAALAEIIVPELISAFALDAAGTAQMLLESIAGDWDTAAEDLRSDNQVLLALLSAALDAVNGAPSRNESFSLIVTEIESQLRENQDGSLTLTSLASRTDALMATLERILVVFEELTGEPGYQEIDAARRSIYAHLRRVAARGWSFWDVSSFRGRTAAVRSAVAGDDARGAVR